MISTTYPVRDVGKWCPHTDSNRGPPDYKRPQGRNNTVHSRTYFELNSLFLLMNFNAPMFGDVRGRIGVLADFALNMHLNIRSQNETSDHTNYDRGRQATGKGL